MKLTFIFGIVLFGFRWAWAFPSDLYRPYFQSTLNGVEALRDQNGLLADVAYVNDECQLRIIGHRTTPTDVGLDILSQLDLAQNRNTKALARKNLRKIFGTLLKLQTYSDGLFFNVYSTEKKSKPLNFGISSIDNLHLALAFFTTMKLFPQTFWGQAAETLFERMDFASFIDEDGQVGGLLEPKQGRWELLPFRYTYWGSETRSLYTLLGPLGLISHKFLEPQLPRPREKYKTALEIFFWKPDKILIKTYDGGAFQLYLPELLIGEDQFAPKDSPLTEAFDNYSLYGIEESENRGYELPAIFTASNRGIDVDEKGDYSADYNGRAGSPELAATESNPLGRPPADDLVSPHGVFMAATRNPSLYLPWIKNMEYAESLYCRNLGFLDGYYIKGDNRGNTVHSQLALDQEMVLLSLIRILSPDHQSASSRVLFGEEPLRKTVAGYYKSANEMIENGTSENGTSP